MKNELRWTLVQHSGYGYNGNHQFEMGLEVRQIHSKKDANLVERVGGVLFNSYSAADDASDEWSYPDGQDTGNDMLPHAMGSFSEQEIDGLRIYIPVRMIVG